MKLHVGCGEKYLPGYKHLDARKFPHVDYVTNRLDKLDMFADNSVEEIYACHLLEHMPRSRIRTGSIAGGMVNCGSSKATGDGLSESSVLREWYRVLKPSGTLRLAVPDFEAIVEEYLANRNLDKLQGLIHGSSKYDKYDFHYQTYDFKRLSGLLTEAGFSEVKRYDWREFLPPNYDDYSRSYMPNMDFEHGRLMSLNVVAIK
ncbi:MAG: methyltransferase domain-containing protein [Quinella sp. 1Q5]|nr:methyltransferase domain-containing protein [Quinella sp. 1Q5]